MSNGEDYTQSSPNMFFHHKPAMPFLTSPPQHPVFVHNNVWFPQDQYNLMQNLSMMNIQPIPNNPRVPLFNHSRNQAPRQSHDTIPKRMSLVNHQSWKNKCKNSTVSINLYDMIEANNNQTKKKKGKWTVINTHVASLPAKPEETDDKNKLQQRGKEREKPVKKKHSTLKRLIIQERKEQEHKRDLMDWKLDCEEEAKEDKNRELAKKQIHNRRFREYCQHCLLPEIDRECTLLLKLISDFQHRAYARDQIKARSKRRYVVGIRQVTKFLKSKLLKCIIMAPNCEHVQADGGLDDMLVNIISNCEKQEIPCIFALDRRSLGKCMNLAVPVSVIGLVDYSGAEVVYKRLKSIVDEAHVEYSKLLEHTITMIDSGVPLKINIESIEDYVEEGKTDRAVPRHTRNLSGTLKPSRVIAHGRNASDICSHTVPQDKTKGDEFKGHSRNPSLISNASSILDGDQINDYQNRIQVEFVGHAEPPDEADPSLRSIKEDAGIDGDCSSGNESSK